MYVQPLPEKQHELKDKIITIIATHKTLDSQSLLKLPEAKQKAVDKLEQNIRKSDDFLFSNDYRIL